MDVLALTQKFPQTQNLEGKDMPTFAVNSIELAEIVQYLRDEQGFDILADLCGVDWKDRSPRFGVVIHLLSTRHREYVRLHAPCVDDAVPTVSSIHPGANWHEREAWEMFGITFAGHPDLRHMYLPTEFEGYPLRKDFPLLARIVKPWPGIVDVEPMPGVADDEGGE